MKLYRLLAVNAKGDIWLNDKTSCALSEQNVYAVDLIQVINNRLNAVVETKEAATEVSKTNDDVKSLYE
jgi:hypothetical protein